MEKRISSRIEGLDWLRGLMAISIMLYHLHWWLLSPLGPNTLLGRLGIYAVSIFFILSGLSMAVVYNAYIVNLSKAIRFEIKRIFRIWPLMWLTIVLTIVPSLIDKYSIYKKTIGLFISTFLISGVGVILILRYAIMHKTGQDQHLNSARVVMLSKIRTTWPVYIGIVVLLVVTLLALKYPHVNQWKILLINLTTTFSIISANEYIVTGGWSIGNEMLYYALTPFIFAIYNKRIAYGNAFTLLSILIAIFYSLFALSGQQPFAEQWVTYIHPLNHLYLYCMGIFIYYNAQLIHVNDILNVLLLATAVLLFIFLPFDGDPIILVTGWGRFLFSFLSIIIVICFYNLKLNLPVLIKNLLESFALSTYSVYLLHPIVFRSVQPFIDHLGLNKLSSLCAVAILTVIIARLVYEYFELRFIKFGKDFTTDH